ncbi:MAG: hypothetical protein R3A47_01005 [Polyangiales bacterium]
MAYLAMFFGAALMAMCSRLLSARAKSAKQLDEAISGLRTLREQELRPSDQLVAVEGRALGDENTVDPVGGGPVAFSRITIDNSSAPSGSAAASDHHEVIVGEPLKVQCGNTVVRVYIEGADWRLDGANTLPPSESVKHFVDSVEPSFSSETVVVEQTTIEVGKPLLLVGKLELDNGELFVTSDDRWQATITEPPLNEFVGGYRSNTKAMHVLAVFFGLAALANLIAAIVWMR